MILEGPKHAFGPSYLNKRNETTSFRCFSLAAVEAYPLTEIEWPQAHHTITKQPRETLNHLWCGCVWLFEYEIMLH